MAQPRYQIKLVLRYTVTVAKNPALVAALNAAVRSAVDNQNGFVSRELTDDDGDDLSFGDSVLETIKGIADMQIGNLEVRLAAMLANPSILLDTLIVRMEDIRDDGNGCPQVEPFDVLMEETFRRFSRECLLSYEPLGDNDLELTFGDKPDPVALTNAVGAFMQKVQDVPTHLEIEAD